jgi:hypothetical protein
VPTASMPAASMPAAAMPTAPMPMRGISRTGRSGKRHRRDDCGRNRQRAAGFFGNFHNGHIVLRTSACANPL